MNRTDKKELEACKYLIKRFKIGYGANCESSDLDDFRKNYSKKTSLKEIVLADHRCASCRAEEAIAFLQKHITLLKP